jgi:hypothetical protein
LLHQNSGFGDGRSSEEQRIAASLPSNSRSVTSPADSKRAAFDAAYASCAASLFFTRDMIASASMKASQPSGVVIHSLTAFLSASNASGLAFRCRICPSRLRTRLPDGGLCMAAAAKSPTESPRPTCFTSHAAKLFPLPISGTGYGLSYAIAHSKKSRLGDSQPLSVSIAMTPLAMERRAL